MVIILPISCTSITVDEAEKNITYEFTDKLGCVLLTRQMGGNTPHDTYNYTYNSRSWLTGISNPLFYENLQYNYNGDISQIAYCNRNIPETYQYVYDNLSRLKMIGGIYNWMEYAYNKNGAMTKDLNAGISKIQYNLLNLPEEIEIKYDNGYYSGPDDKNYFYIKDHLGNVRVVIDKDSDVAQYTDYDPFGMIMSSSTNQSVQAYKYNGKEFMEQSGLNIYDYGARWYDPARIQFWTMDPLAEKYPWISPYAYCLNSPVKYIDPDGREIKLAGTAADRHTSLTHLQRLTNDKLSMRSDGTVIIVRMGGENSGKALTSGSELIRDLNKKGDGARTVTISVGTGGNSMNELNPANAMNGVGSDATVKFDPTANPLIPTKEPTTGNVSDATRPNEIGLGHELIHVDRAMKGVAVDYSIRVPHTYKDANGNSVTVPTRKDELETVGVQGTHKYNENKLRKEQGLNERGAY